MSFRNSLHHLSDLIAEDTTIDWERDWLILLATLSVSLMSGPWSVLAMWIQRWNVRTPWDAQDHWRGTRQFALTFAIADALSIVIFFRFRSILSLIWSHSIWLWIIMHLLTWWIWWLLLTPAFALLLERLDPRMPRMHRVLLPIEQQPSVSVGSQPRRKARKQVGAKSSGDTTGTPPKKQKKGKGQAVPLGQILLEEREVQQKQNPQDRFHQPQPSPAESDTASAVPPAPVVNATPSLPSEVLLPHKQERAEPESLDNLF